MKYTYLFLSLLFSAALSAQVTAICLDNVSVALPDGDCQIALEGDWIDGGSYAAAGSPLTFSVYPAIVGPGEHDVILSVSNGSSRNSCWSTVTVQDHTPPRLTCHAQNIYLVHPQQEHTINADALYTLSDNCGVENLTINVPDMAGYGTDYFSAYAEHSSGDAVACLNTITLHDAEPQNYCNNDLNSGYEHIRQVGFGLSGRQFPTGNDGGYRWHYNHPTVTLYHGSTYTINYTPGFSYNSVYRLYWRVYLDKNGDGDFTDSGELLHQWNGTGVNAFTFNSPGTFWGMSRIRVVMSYGGYASSCSGRWGEVEDISVLLRPFFFIPWPWGGDVATMTEGLPTAIETPVASRPDDLWLAGETIAPRSWAGAETAPAPQIVATEAIKLFPNPVASGAPISITGAAGTTEVTVINAAGQRVATVNLSGSTEVQRINLPKLPAGAYLVRGLANEQAEGWARRVLVR